MYVTRERCEVSMRGKKHLVRHRFVHKTTILPWSRDTSKIQDGRQNGRKVMKLFTMSNKSVIKQNSFKIPNIFDHVRSTEDKTDIAEKSAM